MTYDMREMEASAPHAMNLETFHRLARALGWISVGFGAAQLLAPRRVARLIGLSDDPATNVVMRGVGLRETAAGVGLLTRSRPAGFLWTRVAGDAMDLSMLGRAYRNDRGDRRRVAAAMAAVAAITVPDLIGSARLWSDRGSTAESHRRELKAAITVRRPPEEVYAFWHDFENLPRFMEHLEKVVVTDRSTSRWTARAAAGRTLEWDAEIVDETTGRSISWSSVEGADIESSGVVTFAPAPASRSTEVRLVIRYGAPGGRLGDLVAKLFGEAPEQQVRDDLRRFKQVVELGEVVQSDAAPDGATPSR